MNRDTEMSEPVIDIMDDARDTPPEGVEVPIA
jgi:hypothetical protein